MRVPIMNGTSVAYACPQIRRLPWSVSVLHRVLNDTSDHDLIYFKGKKNSWFPTLHVFRVKEDWDRPGQASISGTSVCDACPIHNCDKRREIGILLNCSLTGLTRFAFELAIFPMQRRCRKNLYHFGSENINKWENCFTIFVFCQADSNANFVAVYFAQVVMSNQVAWVDATVTAPSIGHVFFLSHSTTPLSMLFIMSQLYMFYAFR